MKRKKEWLNLDVERKGDISKEFVTVWRQIARRLLSYDERLMFESMNEPRLRDSEYEWTSGTEELRTMVNELNQTFVDTVRDTGGGYGLLDRENKTWKFPEIVEVLTK